MSMNEQVVLVTGSSGGIGGAVVNQLIKANAVVIGAVSSRISAAVNPALTVIHPPITN